MNNIWCLFLSHDSYEMSHDSHEMNHTISETIPAEGSHMDDTYRILF